jgi:hypothetical protein
VGIDQGFHAVNQCLIHTCLEIPTSLRPAALPPQHPLPFSNQQRQPLGDFIARVMSTLIRTNNVYAGCTAIISVKSLPDFPTEEAFHRYLLSLETRVIQLLFFTDMLASCSVFQSIENLAPGLIHDVWADGLGGYWFEIVLMMKEEVR